MSHLEAMPALRLPRIALVALTALTLGLASCDFAFGDEAPRKVTTSLFLWKLAVLDHDGHAYRRGGDLFGGRAIGSVDLPAGLHLGLRGDASALSADFDAKNPGTWRTVETRAALSRPFAVGPLTAGPAVMAGVVVPVVPVTTEAAWSSRSDFGGGVRLAKGASWAYVLAGKSGTADERAPGTSPVRMLFAGSIEFNRVALVSDFVSGPGGFLRGGIAYRVPVPGGAK